MRKQFTTPVPVDLYVENGSGRVRVRAEDVAESTIVVEGDPATVEATTVEQRHRQIAVVVPRRRTGFLRPDQDVTVTATVPSGSDLTTACGSADVEGDGRLGTLSSRSGSGEVTVDTLAGDVLVKTGSGDVDLGHVGGALEAKSGSGEVSVDTVGAGASVSTGSGDITLGTAHGAVGLKSGSGDLTLHDCAETVEALTGSGDISVAGVHRGRVSAKTASGSVTVRVKGGVPVWTDVSSISGSVSSALQGAGEPVPGQDHVELRVTTVSGDVVLDEQ